MRMVLCDRCEGTGAEDSVERTPCRKCGGSGAVDTFITKDSGQREPFATGAVRDTQTGKPRFDLVPIAALEREADLFGRGAEKYGEGNWEKGMPFSRVYASLFRHLVAWRKGDRTEDHLAAVRVNAAFIMAYEEAIAAGRLPPELDDCTSVR
jgi:hypothetical protein